MMRIRLFTAKSTSCAAAPFVVLPSTTEENSGLTPFGGVYSAMIVGRPRPWRRTVARATIAASSAMPLSARLITCMTAGNPAAKYESSRAANVPGSNPIENVTFSYGEMSCSVIVKTTPPSSSLCWISQVPVPP